ncbi:MAG TPA: DUF4382 domain-containing protein [Gemmatimonadales bacterium]|nr:DUF4382 domain-containing protein [Gemmatimonadales bacterium]
MRPGFQKFLRLSAIVAIAACSDASGPEGTGKVSILLTDAPGDVLEAVVTIDQVYLQGGSSEAEGETEESGRVNLLAAPVTVDLLTLADEWMTLVGDAEIPAGQYGQLRFVVSGAYLKVAEEGGDRIYATSLDYSGLPAGAEVSGSLQTPGFSASGLKVQFPGGVTVEGETSLLVDFDVAESFGHQAGQGDGWIMHPVLKGSVVEPEAVSRKP